MLTPRDVLLQINTLVGYLVEVGLSSDQNMAISRKLPQNRTDVTFPGAENVSFALKNRNYQEIYSHLELNRAYVAKLPDGALLLMRYKFVDNALLQHSLGFFPSPNLEHFQNDPDTYLTDAVYAEVVAKNIVPFPIRFDFDCQPEAVKPVKHPKSHLTLGQYENCRIPVTCPVDPGSFITFILRHFYNTAFNEFSGKAPKFSGYFQESIHEDERSIIHIAIPQIK